MIEKPKKQMPVKKGGTRFPRIGLQQAYEYAKRLVSKTQINSLPEKIVLKGVFDNAGPVGRVRVSALRQYNLLQGDPKGYESTGLAKELVAALDEEKPLSLQKAFLSPQIFLDLFSTFKGDNVSIAKIKQHANKLNVHIDSAEECAEIFFNSALFCQLGTKVGDDLNILGDTTLIQENAQNESTVEHDPLVEKNEVNQEGNAPPHGNEQSNLKQGKITAQVNISVDPSMDPEKLEKLLKLLKQYGAL